MKTKILLFLFCLSVMGAMGQVPICWRCNKPISQHPAPPVKKCRECGRPLSQCPYDGKHPEPEAAGYDVTFSCNVPSASLYIDGSANGTASGTRFLKTGSHTIKVTHDDYEEYTGTITVNRQHRSFSMTLREKPLGYQNGVLRVGNASYRMINVYGGTFTMGATSEMTDPADKEKPTHQVTLSSYYIGETEVTQALWKAVMGYNPSEFKGDNLPVECVSWDDCQEFIRKLNAATGRRFRLPTEAEWEFAARGGNQSRRTQYSGSSNIDDVAWYDGNSGNSTHPVKTKRPNELGLYDMSGNVYEWCEDWYGSYTSYSQTNTTGPNSGSYRVFRGGSWGIFAYYCRSSRRGNRTPGDRFNRLGFRLALSE